MRSTPNAAVLSHHCSRVHLLNGCSRALERFPLRASDILACTDSLLVVSFFFSCFIRARSLYDRSEHFNNSISHLKSRKDRTSYSTNVPTLERIMRIFMQDCMIVHLGQYRIKSHGVKSANFFHACIGSCQLFVSRRKFRLCDSADSRIRSFKHGLPLFDLFVLLRCHVAQIGKQARVAKAIHTERARRVAPRCHSVRAALAVRSRRRRDVIDKAVERNEQPVGPVLRAAIAGEFLQSPYARHILHARVGMLNGRRRRRLLDDGSG